MKENFDPTDVDISIMKHFIMLTFQLTHGHLKVYETEAYDTSTENFCINQSYPTKPIHN